MNARPCDSRRSPGDLTNVGGQPTSVHGRRVWPPSRPTTAGVTVVGVLDPERRTIHLFEGEAPVRIFSEGDELTIPSVLGEFRVPVNRFFD